MILKYRNKQIGRITFATDEKSFALKSKKKYNDNTVIIGEDKIIDDNLLIEEFRKIIEIEKIYKGNLQIFNKDYLKTLKGQMPLSFESINSVIEEYKIYGRSIQNIYSGKNCLYFSEGEEWLNGLDIIEHNQGYISIKGTCTENWSNICQVITKILKSGTYTFSIDHAVNFNVVLRITDIEGNVQDKRINKGKTFVTFTTAKDIKNYYIYIDGFDENTYIDDVIYLMLENFDAATAWEPYVGMIPSPNVFFPQSIISLGDYDTSKNKYKILLNDMVIYLNEPLRAIETDENYYNLKYDIDGISHYFIADYLDFKKQQVIRYIAAEKISSTGWQYIALYNCWFNRDYFINKKIDRRYTPLSTHYIVSKGINSMNELKDSSLGITSATMITNLDALYLKDSLNAPTSETNFINWLKNLNIDINYITTTPKIENIVLPEVKTINGQNLFNVKNLIEPIEAEISFRTF